MSALRRKSNYHPRKVNYGGSLEKGGIDWNLYDENEVFLCSIKISHGKNTKEEVVANSVDKTKKIFKEKGLSWPPKKKSSHS